MIARELTEFFAGFSPDGGPALHRRGDLTFLSNVNACYAARLLGGAALPRRRLRRGPGLRPRDARGRLAEGVPSGRGSPARPRLRAASSSCGATSTSTAACARRAVTWSRSRPLGGAHARFAPTRAGCATRLARAPALRGRPLGGAPRRAAGRLRARVASRRAAGPRSAARSRSRAARRRHGRRPLAAAWPRHGRLHGPRLRGHPSPQPRGARPARRARPRDGGAAHPHRDVIPPFRARKRRPQHDLHAHGAARGARPHGLDLAL